MVRWIWSHRLIGALIRPFRLFVRWLLIWLAYLLKSVTRRLQVGSRFLLMLIRPRDPNNVFGAGNEAAFHAEELGYGGQPLDDPGGKRPTLLWAAAAERGQVSVGTNYISLWRGQSPVRAEDATSGSDAANRRFAYLDVLAAQIKRLSQSEIAELERLLFRLARKWLDVDEVFEWLPRRNRLDVGKTLRYNIPRYAGTILNFKWATKERPIPQQSKPARLLLIGDVSHSMVHYVSVVLYFFHMLNFRFMVESYVFSETATHSSPYLNGLGTFDEKVKRLVSGAKSWNAGTRFGSALEEIAREARVDENTYVIIATDGKVSLQGDEPAKIERCMTTLRTVAKQVVFLTPSVEFSDGGHGKLPFTRIGSFRYGFHDIPLFAVGPPAWYGTLSQYADRLYLVRTVQDLIDMTEDLILSSRG